jgi:hypothetical protein
MGQKPQPVQRLAVTTFWQLMHGRGWVAGGERGDDRTLSSSSESSLPHAAEIASSMSRFMDCMRSTQVNGF